MKTILLEATQYLNNKKGSSIVMLAMVFVTMAFAIAAAIGISRALVVKSECESFGHLWTKAILSEYDIHLIQDYGILAFFGNEAEVQKKIDAYLNYSAMNKLDASIGKSSAQLMGYELGNPDNFKKALKQGWKQTTTDSIIKDSKRTKRNEDSNEEREIRNTVVIDTLPSGGIDNGINIDSIVEKLKEGNILKELTDSAGSTAIEASFLRKYMGNHVTQSNSKQGYFCNEWEYLLHGECDDDANFSFCKRKIFLIRNALNLAYLYKDQEKRALILSIAETLAPGVGGVLTQAVIAETWAAIESEQDIKTLLDNGRVPFMKTDKTWQTGIASVLDSNEIKNELNEEGRNLLEEHKKEFEENDEHGNVENIKDGPNYDDYLLAMIMMMNERVRILRMMDLVQINFKYWYYEDFNMMEYYTGVRFSINANGKDYDFEDYYK